MNLTFSLFRLLLFPGLLFAVPAAWTILWIERKAVARMQQRMGPPFGQPFFDFIKLIGKETPTPRGAEGWLMRAWPVIATAAAAGSVGLLPVLPGAGGFEGDLILLIALLEVPPICLIAAGFTTRSIFGEIGAVREAVLTVAYNLVFLLGLLSIAAAQHTFRLDALAQSPLTLTRFLGLIAILICLPAKLHVNPFSLPNAEQEIYSGPMTEYGGVELALWQLSHGLEWVASCGLVATLATPLIVSPAMSVLAFIALLFVLVMLLTVSAAATARLAIDATVRFYWRCTLALAGLLLVIAISSAMVMKVWS